MRVLVSALLCALMLPAAASASVDGADFNRPFTTADVSDCVYPKARTGIAAFAFDGSYFPFALDAKTAWPGCEHAPGSIRVLKLQALTVGGRTTYMSRGGSGKPHVHIAASDLQRPLGPAPARRPQRQRPRRARLHLPDLRAPDRAAGGHEVQAGPAGRQRRLVGQLRRPRRALRLALHVRAVEPAAPRRRRHGEEVGGGGIIMATIKPRQKLLVCDVTHQHLDAFAPGSSTPSGETEWAYVATQNGGETLYGWALVTAHYGAVAYQGFDWT